MSDDTINRTEKTVELKFDIGEEITNRLFLQVAHSVVCSSADVSDKFKTELLGRLCYCGFVIDSVKISDDKLRVSAHKEKEPVNNGSEIKYGNIIRLKRVGFKAKLITVYKFRTMYPYAEYLQEYIYLTNRLQPGGKFANDFRITPKGRILRKYSLDELPMLWNWIKGDIKFVGVRPLSQQYFSLYNAELQNLRTQFKPGLFPPYYADMPENIEQIQQSEMKYLSLCKTKGIVKTDFSYFWRIFINLLRGKQYKIDENR